MKLHVELSDMTRSSLGSIVAPIWFEFGDELIPGHGWSDFVVVILGWWVPEVRSSTGNIRLLFMDGPYRLMLFRESAQKARVEFRKATMERDMLQWTGIVDIGEFRDAVVDAARAVLQECRARRWASPAIETLAGVLF